MHYVTCIENIYILMNSRINQPIQEVMKPVKEENELKSSSIKANERYGYLIE